MNRHGGKHAVKKPKGRNDLVTVGFVFAITLVIGSIVALILYFYNGSKTANNILPASPEISAVNNQAEVQTAAPVDTAIPDDTPNADTSTPESSVQAGKEMIALKVQLDDLLSEMDSKWGITVQNLSTDEKINCVNKVTADTPMVAASLIKLFIMGAVYEQIENGKIAENNVTEKLKEMITVSDNASANELTALLGDGDAASGMAIVNDFAKRIGCTGTAFNRLMLEENGKQNYTTTNDCTLILRQIYDGKCVSEESSKKMLSLLSAQTRKNKIPAALPKGTSSANKTGELAGFSECDVAIVYTPNCDYILCVMCEPKNNSAAISAIQNISKIVYTVMAK